MQTNSSIRRARPGTRDISLLFAVALLAASTAFAQSDAPGEAAREKPAQLERQTVAPDAPDREADDKPPATAPQVLGDEIADPKEAEREQLEREDREARAAEAPTTGPEGAQPEVDPNLPPRFFESAQRAPLDGIALERFDRYVGEDLVYEGQVFRLDDADLAHRDIIAVDLPDGRTARLLRDRVAERGTGDYSWIGHVEDAYGIAIFVVSDGRVTAQFDYEGKQYQIKPLDDERHVLLTVEPELYPDEETEADYRQMIEAGAKADPSGFAPRYDPGTAGAARANAAASVNCPIRLLVVYTDDVATAHADPLAQIQLATDYYNVSNATSFVAHQVELARVVELPYAEGASGPTGLTAVNDLAGTSDGKLDEAHSLRSLYDADMVIGIFEKISNGCGRADVIGPAAYADAFCVADYGCIAGNLTYAHEFGHLYGARHDVFADGTPGYNHGYTYPPGGWRTVMAYNDACVDAGTSCTRLQFWSNPARNHLGQPTGVAGSSDNESRLDNSYATIVGLEATNTNKVQYATDVIEAYEEGNQYGDVTLATITTQPLTYNSASKGRFEATDEITLREGFWAKSGSTFLARLKSCTVAPPAARPQARSTVVEAPSTELEAGGLTDLAVFPNPARAGEAIQLEYALAADDFTSIEVYALDGRHVETIAYVPVQASGRYRSTWTSARLIAGEYVVVLRTGSEQVSRRLVVVP